MPAETKEGVIALAVVEKVAQIFHGANLMAKYVHEETPTRSRAVRWHI